MGTKILKLGEDKKEKVEYWAELPITDGWAMGKQNSTDEKLLPIDFIPEQTCPKCKDRLTSLPKNTNLFAHYNCPKCGLQRIIIIQLETAKEVKEK